MKVYIAIMGTFCYILLLMIYFRLVEISRILEAGS